jgi:hypothetical protein
MSHGGAGPANLSKTAFGKESGTTVRDQLFQHCALTLNQSNSKRIKAILSGQARGPEFMQINKHKQLAE